MPSALVQHNVAVMDAPHYITRCAFCRRQRSHARTLTIMCVRMYCLAHIFFGSFLCRLVWMSNNEAAVAAAAAGIAYTHSKRAKPSLIMLTHMRVLVFRMILCRSTLHWASQHQAWKCFLLLSYLSVIHIYFAVILYNVASSFWFMSQETYNCKFIAYLWIWYCDT